jgi:hypothetical protein
MLNLADARVSDGGISRATPAPLVFRQIGET